MGYLLRVLGLEGAVLPAERAKLMADPMKSLEALCFVVSIHAVESALRLVANECVTFELS
jgi:hypothetical protein